MRVGVDTGGTFTDCVVADSRGVRVIKVFSGSPASAEDASLAIVEGVARLVAKQPAIDIIHGTTVSTNTLLERRGARVALVTTHGFEDLIEIGRQARPRLYDLDVRRDPPLVARRMRWGLRERTAADGTVLLRPSVRELNKLRDAIIRSGAESVAVCLLFSYSNPDNERLVLSALRSLKIPRSISHEILPEFREYERLSTTTMNAYLMPRVGSYLTRLQREAGSKLALPSANNAYLHSESPDDKSAPGRLRTNIRVFVMESSGGITTATQAAREPVRTILSGPAGGVAAAARLAGQLEIRQAITLDMGGTSTDVCLIEGRARITNETTVGGLPVAIPVIDVHSVGAGGGSLARVDAGGALRVGPESAGASPGPVCYGRGGQQPTVTDAHLILGRIDPECFLGGKFRLHHQAAVESFTALIRGKKIRSSKDPRKLSGPLELAFGIVTVANSNMERALRVISVERGHDPRDFTLIAFGGAGGLHAADLARSLGIARIIVPPNPGTFSALGILLSDAVKDVTQSVLMPIPVEVAPTSSSLFRQCLIRIARRFRQLERSARIQLRLDHFPSGNIVTERNLEVRYAGQSYELIVPFSPLFPKVFERLHEKTYGYTHGRTPLEVVNLRLRLTVPTPRPQSPKHSTRAPLTRPDDAVVKVKNVWFGKRFHRTPLYDRDRLCIGTRFKGPAVVVEYSCTTAVPPDFACRIDRDLNLALTHDAD
jgi:N-methylhydantoinase A